jgi:hypothetical protein
MKYLTEYRDAGVARGLIARIRREATQPWTMMEVCAPWLLCTTLTTVIDACWSLLVRVQVLLSPSATVIEPAELQSPLNPSKV